MLLLILSFGQIMFAAKAGATYVSLFAGRIADEGGNSSEVITETVKWLEHWGFKSIDCRQYPISR